MRRYVIIAVWGAIALCMLGFPFLLFAQSPVTPGMTTARSAVPTVCVNTTTFALESCSGSGGGVTYGTRFSCKINNATIHRECQPAPGPGLRNYVVSVHLVNQVATAKSLALIYGTGVDCATGFTDLSHAWFFGTNGLTTSPFEVSAYFGPDSPLIPPQNVAVCFGTSAATAYGGTITGYIAQ